MPEMFSSVLRLTSSQELTSWIRMLLLNNVFYSWTFGNKMFYRTLIGNNLDD